MRKVAVFLIALVVVSVCLRVPGAESLKDRLPEEAYGYVAVKDVPEFLGKVRASMTYKLAVDGGLLRVFEQVEGFDKLKAEWGRFVEPLGGVLTGELVIAFLPASVRGGEPRVVLGAEVSEDAFSGYVAQVIESFAKERGLPVRRSDMLGTRVVRIGVDPLDPDEELFFCISEGVLGVGLSYQDAALLPRSSARGAVTKLDRHLDFRRAVGTPDVEFYVDMRAIVREVPANALPDAVSRLGIDRLAAVGWGVTLDAEGAKTILRVSTMEPPGGILSVLARAGEPLKSPRYVPEGVDSYFALRVASLEDLYNGMLRTLEQATGLPVTQTPDALPPLASCEQALGMKLADVLPGFGGEIAVAAKQAELNAVPEIVLLIEVKERAVVEELITHVLKMVSTATGAELDAAVAEYGETEIRTVAPSPQVTLAWAFVGDFLVVATSERAVEAVVDTLDEGSALSESERYKALVATVGGTGTITVCSDLRPMLELFARRAREEPIGSAQFAEVLESLGTRKETPLPIAWAFSGDEHGVTYRCACRLEIVEPSLMIGAGMMLPALARARYEAQKAVSMSNVRAICQAVASYSADNEDMLPGNLSDLVVGDYIDPPKAFVHPRGTKPGLIDFDKPETVDQYGDYELLLKGVNLRTLEGKDVSKIMLVREKREFLPGGRMVGYVDGHVEFVRSSKDEE